MSILESIRRKSGLLILVIGIAMVAFILGDLLGSGGDLFSSGRNVVGEVDGTQISYPKFSSELDKYNNQNPNSDPRRALEIVWMNLERDLIMNEEYEKLGISITDIELLNAIKSNPQVTSLPAFRDTTGKYNPNIVERYIEQIKSNPNQNIQEYNMWMNFENQLKSQLPLSIYSSLVNKALYTPYKEGEMEYMLSNEKINADYVYIPYSKISDSLVKVTEEEMISYVQKKNMEKEYKSKGSRDIQYVFIEVKPSLEDRDNALNSIKENLNDKEVYDKELKNTVVKKGFEKTKNNKEFILENSDGSYDGKFYHSFENQEVNKWVKRANKGNIYGPYEENNSFKIAKLEETKTMPDSVSARHILISFKDLGLSDQIQRNKESAKKLADSLKQVLKSKKNNFKNLAKEFSDDKSNSEQSGNLGWFTYGTMVPKFNKFCFDGRKGDVKIVETRFGYHIIEILKQKNISKAYKLAILEKKIFTSEKTDDEVYQKAFKLSSKNYSGIEEFIGVAKDMKLDSRTVEGLGNLEYSIQGLEGNNRSVVRWAFNNETNIGDVKMFDINKGYLISFLYGKKDKDSWDLDIMNTNIKPILVSQKKAEILKKELESINTKDLQVISDKYDTYVKSITSATFNNDMVAGIGREPKFIGALFSLEKDKISNSIEGQNGIFFTKITEKTDAKKLDNYTGFKNQVQRNYMMKGYDFYILEALKKTVEVEDNRANFY